ncbi:MAG: hypothetical protein WC613_02795 [Candidatus Aenigmatarchaeota archaeon]
MLVIIDNGKGAEQIAKMIRGQKTIMKPDKADMKASAFILSDGDLKNQKHNEKIIKSVEKPLLAIGAGYLFLGAVYGAKIIPAKPEKQISAKIDHACPLTLDLKKMFTVVKSCTAALDDLPENFDVIASSKEPEIIADREKPFFGVHFNPEMGGDGMKIIDNFVKFVEMWEKYHKGK